MSSCPAGIRSDISPRQGSAALGHRIGGFDSQAVVIINVCPQETRKRLCPQETRSLRHRRGANAAPAQLQRLLATGCLAAQRFCAALSLILIKNFKIEILDFWPPPAAVCGARRACAGKS